jgi:outer membrane protein assembly factor BamB
MRRSERQVSVAKIAIFPAQRRGPIQQWLWLRTACSLVCYLTCFGCNATANDGSPKSAETQGAEKENPGKETVASVPAPTGVGDDWPQFLGSHDTGISDETGLLKVWPKTGPPILWEKSIGSGYSAPSVRGNRVVLHHRVRNEEIVQCYTADTGDPLWKYSYESLFSDPYGYSNGPRCSPLLTETHCYTFGAGGKLVCLDLKTGDKIWIRDTSEDWTIPDSFFGVGSTPVLHGNLLLVMVGGVPKAGVVAFDAATGKTVWENVGKKLWTAPDDGFQMDDKLASYSSMVVAKIHGQDHLLALMRDGLVSLNPADGKVRFSEFFRSRSFESVNAARPVVLGDQILLSAAYNSGALLLKVDPKGNSTTEVWKSRNLQTHWSTPIQLNGFAYGFSGRHEGEARLRCIDLKTGDIAWETDGEPAELSPDSDDPEGPAAQRYGRGSAILADGKFIVLNERGMLALVDANPKEFKEISRFRYPRLKYPSWAAPVLSRKRIYLRGEGYLVCLDFAPPGTANVDEAPKKSSEKSNTEKANSEPKAIEKASP